MFDRIEIRFQTLELITVVRLIRTLINIHLCAASFMSSKRFIVQIISNLVCESVSEVRNRDSLNSAQISLPIPKFAIEMEIGIEIPVFEIENSGFAIGIRD